MTSSKKRVLLANPPMFIDKIGFNRPVRFPTYNYATPVMHPPLYLAYTAAYLRSLGHEVYFIDAPVSHLKVDEFIQRAIQIRPDVTVFETSTPSLNNDCQVAEKLKSFLPTKIVFVGAHVSARPKESLFSSKAIDAVVIGEYEVSLAEYIEKGVEGTRGICGRSATGQIVHNPPREYIENLDVLPFPARDLLPNYCYFDPILDNPFTFILAGRGCPYRCTYCNWPQVLTGRRYRLRSVGNVLEELKQIVEHYRFKSILFNDDTLTTNKHYVLDLCQGIKASGLQIKWGCYARADEQDGEMLEQMKSAGCYLLKVGVESGNQTLLDNVHKNYNLEMVRRGIRLMLKKGFHVHATFMFGLPGETSRTVKQTVRFAKELNPTTAQFSTIVPYPGTEFFDFLDRNGYLLTRNWDDFMPGKPIFEYKNLSSSELSRSLKWAYRSYYLRPKYIKIGLAQLWRQPRVFLANFKKLLSLIS